MITFLVSYWKELLLAALIAIIAVSHAMYAHEVKLNATLTAQLVISNNSTKQLQSSIDTQNAAIDALKSQAAIQVSKAAAALAVARNSANLATSRANAILAQSVPVGATDCDAANSLINGVLK